MQISQFQTLMKKLYYENDEKRGIPVTYMWFMEEVGELSESIRKFLTQKETNVFDKDPNNVLDTNDSINNIKEEMADVVAWLCSLANLLNIDLEDAVYRKYPDKCGKCGHNPCACNH